MSAVYLLPPNCFLNVPFPKLAPRSSTPPHSVVPTPTTKPTRVSSASPSSFSLASVRTHHPKPLPLRQPAPPSFPLFLLPHLLVVLLLVVAALARLNGLRPSFALGRRSSEGEVEREGEVWSEGVSNVILGEVDGENWKRENEAGEGERGEEGWVRKGEGRGDVLFSRRSRRGRSSSSGFPGAK